LSSLHLFLGSDDVITAKLQSEKLIPKFYVGEFVVQDVLPPK